MRKLLLTLAAVAALVAATLGSTAAPAPAQSISQGDGSVRSLRGDLSLMVSILPYVEQDSLVRIMSTPEGRAALGFGIGSILDGWGNRDMDIGAFALAGTGPSTWQAMGTRNGGEAIGGSD